MINETNQTITLYFPLWGVNFDSDKVGGIGQGVGVYIPYPEEWRTIQQTDVWMAEFRNNPLDTTAPMPPCCIVVMSSLGNKESIHEAIEEQGEKLVRIAHDTVTTLRLYRAGWFLQPELAFFTFYAPDLPINNVVRSPGPYRQAFVTGTAHLPMPGYGLSIHDCSEKIDTPGPISIFWELIQSYRNFDGDTSIDIAIESFNHSYGYQLIPTQRVSNMFIALDAMLGGMNKRKIGKVSIKQRGFTRRVETALSTAKKLPFLGAPHMEARWLNYKDGGRGLRNAIAHGEGQTVSSIAEESYDRLQAIIRVILCQYIQFFLLWSTEKSAIATRLDIPTESPLAAAYVKTLEAEFKEPDSMQGLLL
ncbi:MAG: hypothetical protein QNK31_06560 [Porticoccus sp.]|nr:hypothetical protein [Porticoccus sp.]